MWPFSESYPERKPEDVDGSTYDYVVIGGGTAGAVLASKLSEDPSVSVLVIERGLVNDTWALRVPLMSMNYVVDSSPTIVDYRTVAVPARGGFKLSLLSAHILGGGSRINATIATRGVPGGYNDWAESLGLTDWSWARVEPYFKALENAIDAKKDPSRGQDGPVMMRHIPSPHKFFSYLDGPCETLGLPVISDPNSSSAPAQCYSDMNLTIDQSGKRISSFSAFLNSRIAKERETHLTVCTGTVATRLEVDTSGRTVTGVHIRRAKLKDGSKGGRDCFVKVRREAIVCSGSFYSPQVLLLSGIGPKDSLKKHDISCVRDLPVGRVFKDHLLFGMQVEVPQSESVLAMQNNVFVAIWQLLLYVFWGVGMLANTTTPRAIWLKTENLDDKTMVVQTRDDQGNDTLDAHNPRNIPNIEFMPTACTTMDRFLPGKSGFSLLACLTQPESTGTLELASRDPEDYAKVVYPYFNDKTDMVTARKAARFSMRLLDEFLHSSGYPYEASILTAPTINRLPADWNESEVGIIPRLVPIPDQAPGRDVTPPKSATRIMVPRQEIEKSWDQVTDEEIDEYVLAMALPGNHGSCTCRMSLSPKDGVVDQRLKVHGMSNLRVADASVFPKLTSGHTQVPVMMIGARCADFVKADWKSRT